MTLTPHRAHPVKVALGDQELADISGTKIVYTDFTRGGGDIMLFDISTGVTTQDSLAMQYWSPSRLPIR